MKKSMLSYFQEGFLLVNKGRILILIGLVMSLAGGIPDLLGSSPVKSVFQLLMIVLVFVDFGFSYGLPIFLTDIQEGKTLDLKKVVSVTLENTKRLFLPILLIFGGFFAVVFISIVVIGVFLKLTIGGFDFERNIVLGINPRILIFSLVSGLLSVFSFSAIFYSLEKNSFIKSLINSARFCFRNLRFTGIIFSVLTVTSLISSLYLTNNQNGLQLLIRSGVYVYESMVVAAAALLYYQSKKEIRKD